MTSNRLMLVLGLTLAFAGVACGGGGGPVPDGAPASDGASAADAHPLDGGTGVLGDSCGQLDGGFVSCMSALVCCYPCGTAGCTDACTMPCAAGDPSCGDNGCPVLP